MVVELAAVARNLVWEKWDDVFVVLQRSSAETHIFNDITAYILTCLEQGPLSIQSVKEETERALDLAQGELASDDFLFALGRLEELGLVDRVDGVQCFSVT
jgi:PqqD family protein of HPr-rel-A system